MVNSLLVDGIVSIITKIIKPFADINTTLSGLTESITKGLYKTFVEEAGKLFTKDIKALVSESEKIPEKVGGKTPWKSPVDFARVKDIAIDYMKTNRDVAKDITGTGLIAEALNPLSQGSIPHFINTALTVYGVFNYLTGYYTTSYDRTLFTPMRFAVNYDYTPEYLTYSDLLAMRSRYIINDKDFLEGVKYHGIDVNHKLFVPTEWYDEDSILKHFAEPEKWVKKDIGTWGDALIRLCGEPAGYFLLSMASRTGYYDEEVFKKALLDSNYGILPMGIALQAFRKAFLRRWLTKYEDGAIEEFLAGDIDDKEFHDRLISLEYTEDVATIFTKFFKNRRDETRRKAVIAVYRKAYQRGKISKDEFKRYLLGKGYDLDSIDLIIDIADEEIVGEKFLTKAELVKLYKHDLLTDEELKTRFLNIYADKDEADLAYRLEKKLKEGGAV